MRQVVCGSGNPWSTLLGDPCCAKSWPIGRHCASARAFAGGSRTTPWPRAGPVAALLSAAYVAAAEEEMFMTPAADLTRFATGLAVLALIGCGCAPSAARAGSEGVEFAPHRAIYDLKLADSRGRRQLTAVQGRIVYDFSGSVCEGYTLQFRQVTELDNGEGKVAVSDLRSATWEEGDANQYRF